MADGLIVPEVSRRGGTSWHIHTVTRGSEGSTEGGVSSEDSANEKELSISASWFGWGLVDIKPITNRTGLVKRGGAGSTCVG